MKAFARRLLLVLALCAGVGIAHAQSALSTLYLELDGHWYILPWSDQYSPTAFMYYNNGYVTINLPTATMTLCAPKVGSDPFASPFLFYGQASNPIYQWTSMSYSAVPGDFNEWMIQITTANGTFVCNGEVPSPLDLIFENGFEGPHPAGWTSDTIFMDGFEP